jgi:hypothetical protein
MTPRRLIPYLLVFLVLAGTYGGLQWQQSRKAAQEQQAKEVFSFKPQDITGLTLIRGAQTVRLVKQDQVWRLAAPLEDKADQGIVDAMVMTLARLASDRRLGPQPELKPFGLDKPGLVVGFPTPEKSGRLALGAETPGGRAWYALKDQGPEVLVISGHRKDSLDKSLLALRDKTLLAFSPDKVAALKITTDDGVTLLEKTGPGAWRQAGQDDFKVRGDRVETLLRQLQMGRIKDFPAEPPELRDVGLAPEPAVQVALRLDSGQVVLSLGDKQGARLYGRGNLSGPVVQVEPDLADHIDKLLASLEDRRLWPGPVTEVAKIVWGPPDKPWTAAKEKDGWKVTSPEGAVITQSAPKVEMALWRVQNLEFTQPPGAAAAEAGAGVFAVELWSQDGQPLARLAELPGGAGADVLVRWQRGDAVHRARLPRQKWQELLEDLNRLTAAPKM